MASQHEVIDGAQLVRELRLGERQVEGPLAVFPLFAGGGSGIRGAEARADEAACGEHAAPRRRAAVHHPAPGARRGPRA